MSPKVIGLVLLVGGGVLLYMGWQEKESFQSSVSETFQGTPTDRSMWFLGGGAVAAILGAGLLFKGGKRT
jgi:threonine/homoserine/homoserine lactone efflux protein